MFRTAVAAAMILAGTAATASAQGYGGHGGYGGYGGYGPGFHGAPAPVFVVPHRPVFAPQPYWHRPHFRHHGWRRWGW